MFLLNLILSCNQSDNTDICTGNVSGCNLTDQTRKVLEEVILNKSYDTFRQGESISISDISTWVNTKRVHSIDQLQTDNQLIDSQTSSIYMKISHNWYCQIFRPLSLYISGLDSTFSVANLYKIIFYFLIKKFIFYCQSDIF